MGKWAQYSRRGAASRGQSSPAPQLLLAAAPPGSLTWTWDGADPDHWQAYGSATLEGEFTPQGDPLPGASRVAFGLDPMYYRLVGLTVDEHPAAGPSNTVLLES